MPTNASPEFAHAEKQYHAATTDEEVLVALQKMLSYAPAHKGGENLRADIKAKIKKLKEDIIKRKKSKRGKGKEGIRKADLQAALVGLGNSGKSSILSALTNATPQISQYPYTTRSHILGTLDYENIKIQLVDLPACESEFFDSGIANMADVALMVITNLEDLEKIQPLLERAKGRKIIIYNKIDLLNEIEKRKLESKLRTKKLNFIMFSAKTKENIRELKEKIFQSFDKIRIYTKQPKKPADKEPVIMPQKSTVKDVAEKIFHGLSSIVKESRVSGPSSKFSNQKVGLDHVLKDKDIVEFRT